MSTAYNVPTRDWVTTTLNGALTSSATSATIASGLNIPASSGILQIDYDSSTAVGSDNGPETVTYTSYNSGTGALTGLTRGADGGSGVAHANGAKVQAGMSILYLNQDIANIVQQTAFSSWTPTWGGFSVNPSGVTAKYIQLGKIVLCYLDLAAGTSNATNFTLTLPVSAKFAVSVGPLTVTDNGSLQTTPGRMVLTAASTTATVYKDSASTGWTAANGKGAVGSWWYEAN